jgi:hypothetical protein
MKDSKMMMPPFMKKGAAKPMKPTGMKPKKYAKGGGIESKGKTRGKMC